MRTPASVAGHPIHAMLIVFPVGLFIFSLVCDLISLRSADPATWATVALYTMVPKAAGGYLFSAHAAGQHYLELERRLRSAAQITN